MTSNVLYYVYRQKIIDLASIHRVSVIYETRSWVDAGGLMSYGHDVSDLSRRAAVYVDKIFRGAKPGDLPIQRPTKFELIINLKAVRAIGLTIPPSLLARADQVIE